MKKKQPDVSIIIVSYGTKDLTLACIKSVTRHTKGVSYELIVVDNASIDGSVEVLKKLKTVIKNFVLIESKENLGFSGGNNLGMKRASGKYILLLNSDTQFYEDALSSMVSWMDTHVEVGIATCMLRNPDGSIQATGGRFPTLLPLALWSLFLDDIPQVSDVVGSYHPHTPTFLGSNYYKKPRRLDWTTGAFMLVRALAYNDVGEFDTSFFMYAEDMEYCYRVKQKGWQVWYVPKVSIMHIGGASSGGMTVQFSGGERGKEKSVVGEFQGIKIFYKKHLPKQYLVAHIFLKIAAIARFFTFGFLLGQKGARTIYAKAFQII